MKTTRPQRTVISLAIATALSTMVPTVGVAQTVISVNTSATQHWNDNDFTVNSGVTLNSDAGDHAVYADSGGTLGSLINNGTINGADGGIVNSGTIIQLFNNGTVSGATYYGVANLQGSIINQFRNSGSVSGGIAGIGNSGRISSFVNEQTGMIHVLENASGATISDLVNEGTISKLENSGAITASSPGAVALINSGTITELENKLGSTIDGLLGIFNIGVITTLNNQGAITGLVGVSSGNIGVLNNSGSITGNGGAGLSIEDGTLTTLNNSGTIRSLGSDGISNYTDSEITALNNQLGGVISGVNNGILNAGLITGLTNSGDIEGAFGISNGNVSGFSTPTPAYTGTIGTLINTGTIRNTVSGGLQAALFNGVGSSIGTLDNRGTISGDAIGIFNFGTITTLNNGAQGTISGYIGVANAGTITELTNSGKISAAIVPPSMYSVGINNGGVITTLTNNQSGIITDGDVGIANAAQGVITTLLNHGSINGNDFGVFNDEGEITTFTNNGTISGGSGALLNRDKIGTLNNNQLMHGQGNGISNASLSSIGTLNNSGTISSDNQAAISNSGVITALNNKVGGQIKGGISNNVDGEIVTLDNKGTIAGSTTSAGSYGLYSEGNIGSLNNSGLITSPVDAIFLDAGATMGTFTNSGTVAGRIINASGAAMFINGGNGTTFGLLTGYSGGKGTADIGQIDSVGSHVIFGTGNQLLNDHINVGSGKYVGNLGGVLQVNNHINITGDYVQAAAATLNIGAASGAVSNGESTDLGYGRLIVSGSANIDAGSSVMLKNVGSYRFANGQRYLVVQASATGTNYNEGSLHYGATGFNGTVSGSSITDGGHQLLLLTLDGGTQNLATNGNSQAVLNGLFNYTGTDSSLLSVFNPAAALSSSEESNRAGAQLSPTAGRSSVAGASNAVGQQVNNIAFSRLDGGPTTPGSSGVSGGDAARDIGMWAQAFGGKASADEREGVAGYHASYAGLLFGADTALNDQWRAGGLFNYASTSVSNDGNNAGSYARVNSYGVTGYAGYKGEPWYLNMSVGAMRSDVKAHRVVDIVGFNGVANSNYHGSQYIAAVQAGYPLNIDTVLPGAVLTPLAGLTYSSLRQDGYTETGGNGAALTVGSSSTHSVKSDLGVKLERAYKTSQGVLKPIVQLLWRHEYSDTRLQSVANFAADTSGATSFVTQGPKPVKDTGVLSLGATLLRNDNLSLSVNYTLEQGGGYTSQTGSLLARWRF